jgi:hypothetical protein
MALSTEIRVSCLIAAGECQAALQVLHDEFFGTVPTPANAPVPGRPAAISG